MTGFAIKRVGHVGIWVKDMVAMQDFFTRVLGFIQTDEAKGENEHVAYFTRSPGEHHQIVLAVGDKDAGESGSLHDVFFSVQSLADLKDAYGKLCDEFGTAAIEATDHGNSWSIQFNDVEDNNYEILCPTPWRVSKPYREPLDLSASVEEIIEKSKSLAFASDSTKPSDAWRTEAAARLKKH